MSRRIYSVTCQPPRLERQDELAPLTIPCCICGSKKMNLATPVSAGTLVYCSTCRPPRVLCGQCRMRRGITPLHFTEEDFVM